MRRPAAVLCRSHQCRLRGFQTGDQCRSADALSGPLRTSHQMARRNDHSALRSDRTGRSQLRKLSGRFSCCLSLKQAAAIRHLPADKARHGGLFSDHLIKNETVEAITASHDRAETQRSNLLDSLSETMTVFAPRQQTCGEGYRLKMYGGRSNNLKST